MSPLFQLGPHLADDAAVVVLQNGLCEERVAAMLTDILSDKTARMSAFGDQNILELDFAVAVLRYADVVGHRLGLVLGRLHQRGKLGLDPGGRADRR